MVETDISSLKQFGKQFNKSQSNNNAKKSYVPIKNKKNRSEVSLRLKKYKKQVNRVKRTIVFSMKKKYESLQIRHVLNKKQKDLNIGIECKNVPLKRTYLKESKKQFGNTTIIIRKRVSKPNHTLYSDPIEKAPSHLFDITIPNEKD
jgi:hypothetical protein